MDEVLKVLEAGLALLGLSCRRDRLLQLQFFTKLVLAANRRYNLTAITDLQEVSVKHLLDSLLVTRCVSFTPGMRVLDVGSGGGFPGMPLKIWEPGLEMVLLEATRKKVDFLAEAIAALSLKRIEAVAGRAEEIGQKPAYREQFDCVVSRAVAALPVLAEYTLPFTRCGGMVVAFKGPEVDAEIEAAERAITLLGGRVSWVYREQLPLLGHTRSFVVIVKEKPTPLLYPRRVGVPARRPL